MVSTPTVGTSVGHVEGPEKVSGRARYAGDITLPGMLCGKCLRSPHPHARIVSIDTSRAKALPGVHAVITGAELPDRLIGRRVIDVPVLARDKVRFVGEKVAAVAADSPEIADEALLLIDVEYEELPAVFDPLEAMKDDAPRIHADPGSYRGVPQPAPEIPNVVCQTFARHGDVSAGFAEADRVFEHTFRVSSVHQGYIEPPAGRFDAPGGRLGLPTGGFGPDAELQSQSALIAYLEANRGRASFLVAVPSSMSASSIIIQTGEPVMAMGGFSGGDPILTAEDVAREVADGTVRFFLLSAPRTAAGTAANGDAGTSPSSGLPASPPSFVAPDGASATQPPFAAGPFTPPPLLTVPGRDSTPANEGASFGPPPGALPGPFGGNSAVQQWVTANCTTVPAGEWQSSAGSSLGFGGAQQLYDCASGRAGAGP